MTTGSIDRPFPSCLYDLSRNFPRGVGKRHSDTYCVLVVSSAFEVSNPAPIWFSNERGPFDRRGCTEEPSWVKWKLVGNRTRKTVAQRRVCGINFQYKKHVCYRGDKTQEHGVLSVLHSILGPEIIAVSHGIWFIHLSLLGCVRK